MRQPSILLLILVAACKHGFDTPPPEIELDSEELVFDAVACGESSTNTLAVANTGGSDLELDVVSTIEGVTVVPAHMTVAADSELELSVTAGVPPGAIPGYRSRGDLLFFTNLEGAPTISLPLSVETAGANVSLDTTQVDFGELLPNSSVDRQLIVRLTGTTPVTAVLEPPTSSSFTIVGAASSTILPEVGYHAFTVRIRGASTPQQQTAIMPLSFSGPLCGTPPKSARLIGSTTTAPFQLDHTSFDLGTAACNGPGLDLYLGLENHSQVNATFSARLVSDPAQMVALGTTTGTLFPNVPRTMRVGRRSIPDAADPPAGAYDASLEVSVNSGVTIRTLPIHGVVSRPVIALSALTIDVGTVKSGLAISKTLQVTNTGNAAAMMTVGTAPGVVASPQTFALAAGAVRTIYFTITPPSGAFASTLSVTDDCADQGVTIRGTGQLASGGGGDAGTD